jgi:hypothetical protein
MMISRGREWDWMDKKIKVMNEEETYSIPIYENGVKTEWSVDGIIGDEKYQQLIEMTPEKKLPDMVNVNLNQNNRKL